MFDHRIRVAIVDKKIQQELYEEHLMHPDVGAHSWFLGVTRRTTAGKITTLLHYEAHREMAVKQMSKIAIEAAEQFSLAAVVLVHRLGEVPVGQASVLVGCCSAHRPESLAALPWIMNRLKQDVPIWKKEFDAHGEGTWVHRADPAQ